MVDAGFHSENIVAQVVEGLANVFYPEDDDNKDNIIQMDIATSHTTQMSPQLLHQMQQIKTLMAHIKTQLNNTNKHDGNDKNTRGGNKSNKVPFLRQLYY